MLISLVIVCAGLIALQIWWACKGTGRDEWSNLSRSIYPSIIGLVVFALAYLVYMGVVRSAGSMLIIGISFAPMAVTMLGGMLIGNSRLRRGRDLVCTHCTYNLEGLELADVPKPCPECGRGVSLKAGTARGVLMLNRRLLGVGVFLFFVGLLVPLSNFLPAAFRPMPLVLSLAPTSALITHVSQANGFLMDEWAELNSRTLNADQRETLALGLLEHRTPLQLHAWSDDTKWLIAQATAGRLSDRVLAAAVGRLVSPMFQSEIGSSSLWTSPAQAWGLAGCFPSADLWLLADAGTSRASPIAAPAALGVTPSTFDNRPGFALTSDVFAGEQTRVTLWVFVVPKGTPPAPVTWDGKTPSMPNATLVVPLEVTR